MKLINLLTAVLILTFFANYSFGNPECPARGFAGFAEDTNQFLEGEDFGSLKNKLKNHFVNTLDYLSWDSKDVYGDTVYRNCSSSPCTLVQISADDEDEFSISVIKEISTGKKGKEVISSFILEKNGLKQSPQLTINIFKLKGEKFLNEVTVYSQYECGVLASNVKKPKNFKTESEDSFYHQFLLDAHSICANDKFVTALPQL